MEKDKKQLRIAVSVILQDAGEATRSVEIMKIIRDSAPESYSVQVTFLTHGSKFEKKVTDCGFSLLKVDPPMKGDGYLEDFKPSALNFIGDKELAYQVLRGEIDGLKKCSPDLVIYGFSPFAGIASKMLVSLLPTISFLPLPFEADMFSTQLLREIPDQVPLLSYLPKSLQHIIMQKIPASVKLKVPVLKQQYLLDAAARCGWKDKPLQNLFDMLKADLTIVNDLPLFYKDVRLPDNFKLTGPLYSPTDPSDTISSEITAIFQKQRSNQINLFCTMGSSARKEFLVEAVKAVISLPADQYHAVILVPKAVCPIEEIRRLVSEHRNIYITDTFIPARLVNALADLTICHGGQGTIQTAMVCGCPVLGFAMQPEQQINLDNIARAGAGIRISAKKWKKRFLIRMIKRVTADPIWKQNAARLQAEMSKINTQEMTAAAVWNFLIPLYPTSYPD